MLKFAVVAPPETTTDTGTVTADELLESTTIVPLEGAGLEIVTVPTLADPPKTVAGLTLRAEMTGGFTVKVAVNEPLPNVAVTTACEAAATDKVLTVKVAVFVPAATVTVARTVAND